MFHVLALVLSIVAARQSVALPVASRSYKFRPREGPAPRKSKVHPAGKWKTESLDEAKHPAFSLGASRWLHSEDTRFQSMTKSDHNDADNDVGDNDTTLPHAKKLARVFELHDLDEDGELDFSEVVSALRSIGVRIDANGPDGSCMGCIQFHSEADTDNNGVISVSEFAHELKSEEKGAEGADGILDNDDATAKHWSDPGGTELPSSLTGAINLSLRTGSLPHASSDAVRYTFKRQSIAKCSRGATAASRNALANPENTPEDLPRLMERWCLTLPAPEGAKPMWEDSCAATRHAGLRVFGKEGANDFNPERWCEALSSAWSIEQAKAGALALDATTAPGMSHTEIDQVHEESRKALEMLAAEAAAAAEADASARRTLHFSPPPVAAAPYELKDLYIEPRPCCEDHGGKGCHDQVIEDCVCARDASCCKTKWDLFCAELVEKLRVVDGALNRCGRCPNVVMMAPDLAECDPKNGHGCAHELTKAAHPDNSLLGRAYKRVKGTVDAVSGATSSVAHSAQTAVESVVNNNAVVSALSDGAIFAGHEASAARDALSQNASAGASLLATVSDDTVSTSSEALSQAASAIGEGAQDTGKGISSAVETTGSAVVEAANEAGPEIVEGISSAGSATVDKISDLTTDAAETVSDALNEGGDDAIDAISNAAETIGDSVGSAAGGLSDGVSSTADTVSDGVTNTEGTDAGTK
jgi:hypothetical protein